MAQGVLKLLVMSRTYRQVVATRRQGGSGRGERKGHCWSPSSSIVPRRNEKSCDAAVSAVLNMLFIDVGSVWNNKREWDSLPFCIFCVYA